MYHGYPHQDAFGVPAVHLRSCEEDQKDGVVAI